MNPKELGLTVNQIIRYGYGGLLLFLVSAIIDPCITSKITQSLGAPLSIFIGYALGGVIYVFYRSFLGEHVIWPLTDLIHEYLDSILWVKNRGNFGREYIGTTCKRIHVEKEYKIDPYNSLEAYRLIRNNFSETFQKGAIEIQNSEIHLLYISFIILLPAGIFSLIISGTSKISAAFMIIKIVLVMLFILAWVIGLYAIVALFYYFMKKKHKFLKLIIVLFSLPIICVAAISCPLILFSQFMDLSPVLIRGCGMIILALLCFLFAIIADIDVCRRECAILKNIDKIKIEELLVNAFTFKNAENAGENEGKKE
jgi:hypothetical protein